MPIPTEINIIPVYYKHRYGGIYRHLMYAVNKDLGCEEVVVYQHIFPFEQNTFVRKKQDFMSNYKVLSDEELNMELQKDKYSLQKEITTNKANNTIIET